MTRARVQTFEDPANVGVIGDVFLRDPSSATGGSWSAVGRYTSAFKTADEDVSLSTTLQDDDELTLAVVAGRRYYVLAALFASVAGTSGIKLGFGGTCTITTMKIQATIFDSVAGPTTARMTALGQTVENPGAGGADTYNIVMAGAIEVNAAGTLLVQWAQQSSKAAAATMQIASTIALTRLT